MTTEEMNEGFIIPIEGSKPGEVDHPFEKQILKKLEAERGQERSRIRRSMEWCGKYSTTLSRGDCMRYGSSESTCGNHFGPSAYKAL